jgi:hypothetical protein
MIAEIFSKICEPMPPDMPFTVGRVLLYYLARSHLQDSTGTDFRRKKVDVWRFLESELKRCNKAVRQPLLWYRRMTSTLPQNVPF